LAPARPFYEFEHARKPPGAARAVVRVECLLAALVLWNRCPSPSGT